MKNGYTQIPNELLEAKYKSFQSLTKTESAIFEVIERKTYGWHKNNDWITQSQIAKELKIDRFRVSKAVKKLTEKNMITNNKIKKKKIIGIQVDFSKWKLSEQTTNMLSELTTKYKTNNKMLSKQTTDVVSIDNRMLSKQTHTKETITKETITKDIYSNIISYLNEKAEKNYKVIPAHTKFIALRIKEGNYTLDDFKKVIDNKVATWKGTIEYDKHLRPETLFGNKFEGYLNEKIIDKKDKEEDWRL